MNEVRVGCRYGPHTDKNSRVRRRKRNRKEKTTDRKVSPTALGRFNDNLMIPFKALLSDHEKRCGSQRVYAEPRDCENGSERVEETQEFKRFSSLNSRIYRCISRGGNEGVQQKVEGEAVEITTESNDEEEVAFWSWSRIRRNVGLKGGGIWQEFSGAFGDAGTFVPAVLALALVDGLDLGTTILFTGIFNLATGLVFGIPIPVQPMNALVLAALAPDPLTVPQIMAAGMITALVLGTLGNIGLIDFLYRLIPIPVVRGVMLGEGLMTAIKAVKIIIEKQDLTTMQSLGMRSWLGITGVMLPITMLLFLGVVSGDEKSSLSKEEEEEEEEEMGRSKWARREIDKSGREPLLSRRRTSVKHEKKIYDAEGRNWKRAVLNVPSALWILLIGVSLGIARNPNALKDLELGPSPLKIVKISSEDWKAGLLLAAVYQIPVSILSSVISISKLSNDYFPDEKVKPSSVCSSMLVMNFLGCWFGAVPVCHGAVGLAGQHKFGARSGLSMVMLGTTKLTLGLLLGSSVLGILSQFPESLLGILLLFSGLELAVVCLAQNTPFDALVTVAVAVISIGAPTAYNTSFGFICGLVFYLIQRLHEWLEK